MSKAQVYSPVPKEQKAAVRLANRLDSLAGPRNVLEHFQSSPEVLLESIAAAATSIGSNNAYMPADLLVILNPEHAAMVAQDGWTKSDVKRFLFEKARNPANRLYGRGITPRWPKWVSHLDDIPVVERAEDILVVVAGGWGLQSMVVLPWGLTNRLVHRPIRI